MRIQHAILCLLVPACTQDIEPHINLPPNNGVRLPAQGSVPGAAFSFGSGTFQFTGPTTPGNANVVAAPVVDEQSGPSSYGTGNYNITLAPTNYASALSSLAMLTEDPDGNPYLVFGGFREYTVGSDDVVDQVVVFVKQSDFAVGATVPLDGVDRVALFGTGLATSEQPDIMGAAISGTVTFTAGSLAIGDAITASVQGDFGEIDDGPGPGTGGSITAGNYTLAVQGPGEVYCDGSLVGQESAFASVTAASLSLTGGAVAVATPSAAIVEVAGAPIAAAFGASPFALGAMDTMFVGITNQTGAGPAGTSLVGKYFVVDADSATPSLIYGGAGAGYETADGLGTCTVAFGATLSL